ncbi:MAG: hypothetical protein J6X75_05080 [Clostridia bacterium]|nr:hypothetical protein [Clostridia bacterium]
MSTLIVNSNRIDLIDPISGKNKSITIDEVSHKAIIDDGSQINELANQSSVDALATAVNNLASAIGTLASLTTEVKTDLVSAINEVDANASEAVSTANSAQSDATSALTNIGTLTNLTTDAKTDLVSAINEVDGHADSATSAAGSAQGDATTALNSIGTLSSLTTTEKSNLVGAINEVASEAGGASSDITALTSRVNSSASQLYGHTVLATTDFIANSDVVTGTEFPYKAIITVGSLSCDKSAATFSCQTFFDSESVLAENFASFTNCVASYDSGASTTSFANTIYAREPMVVDVTSVVTFTSNVY